MNDVAFLLLSAEGREEVRDLWYAAKDYYWSNCPISKVYLLTGVNEHGWTHQLLRLLETVKETWLLMLGDDGCIGSPVKEDILGEIYNHVSQSGEIVTCHLCGMQKDLLPYLPLEGYGKIQQKLIHRASVAGPAFWRTSTLIEMTKYQKSLITDSEQDWGWTGFYSWELHAWRVLQRNQSLCLAPINYGLTEEKFDDENWSRYLPWKMWCTTGQGKWNIYAKDFFQRIGYEPLGELEFFSEERDTYWCVDRWRKAPPIRGFDES